LLFFWGVTGKKRKELVMSESAWIVYTIIERPSMDKSFWLRIGRAFVNRDGSFNMNLDALPVNGKLHLRQETQRDRASAQARAGASAGNAGAEAAF